jgi:1-acyl-sn-glycerol-3-phosphate acyltransferase
MESARLRLGALWIAHVCRVMADNCLRILVALQFAHLGHAEQQSAWHLVTLILIIPAVLFAPINGAICNSLAKPRVLAASAFLPFGAMTLLFLTAFALQLGGTGLELSSTLLLALWGLIAISSAVNGPVRYAFLPAAATDTRWPLTRINGFFELGSAAAIVAGLLLGARMDSMRWRGQPFEMLYLLWLVSFFVSLNVCFKSDVSRPESLRSAVAGFFSDCRRIWAVKEARGCLLGLAALRGLMTGTMGALIAASLDGGFSITQLLGIGGWIMAGVAAGSFLAGLQRHPKRVLGLVPWGATGLTIGLIIAAFGSVPGEALCVILGIAVGLINVPLAATYQADLPADARGNGMAVRNFADYVMTALMAGVLFVLARWVGWTAAAQLWLIAGLAALLAALSWRLLMGAVFEQFLEIVIWPIYRIKGYGPGIDAMPATGPVLVIANHTAWMDPVWTSKVLPRRLVGMLTSTFFDLPVLRWVLTHLAETIRVEQSSFRREVPELQRAIAVLDRGDCVLIFPEGALRKKEENLLKQFGQGVWHILSERPQVPVVVCWIEGGWGSYFSYFNGRPTKNKRFDFWRRIRVAVRAPQVVPAEILADHRSTRQYLMKECLEARRILGLEVPVLDNAEVESQRSEVGSEMPNVEARMTKE